MRINELLRGVKRLNGNAYNPDIKGICSDSRLVKPKDIFVAIKGTKRDGNNYIKEAIKNGASAIITDDEDKQGENIILVDDARSALAKMWSNYYKNPSKRLKIIAITGTNGKTSTAVFLYNILKKSNKKCGLISTIRCVADNEYIDTGGGGEVMDICSSMTTPDPSILYSLIYKMKKKGCKYVVMEASSHSLEQCKLDGLDVYLGAFTNLSEEHLDYHKDMEMYFRAKEKLFMLCDLCVISIDSDYGERLLSKYRGRSFSVSAKKEADYKASDILMWENGIHYIASYEGKRVEINSHLMGEFNVYNSLCALACADILKIGRKSIKRGILETIKIDGRLERYEDRNIFIDYAHTPEAIKSVLTAVRGFSRGKKIIALFGCGGDRDKGKRCEMGAIACSLADKVIITSDNPRKEDPKKIIDDIICGAKKYDNFTVVEDRREAIRLAVKEMDGDTVLLLLGKGHERYEIINGKKMYFDERKILKELLADDSR